MSDTTIAAIVWVIMMVFFTSTLVTARLIIKGKPIPKILKIVFDIKDDKENE
jgi:hypothetical protein